MLVQASTRSREFQVSRLRTVQHIADLPLKDISLDRENFPLTVRYGNKTYILVLTKSNKLLLQKPFEEVDR